MKFNKGSSTTQKLVANACSNYVARLRLMLPVDAGNVDASRQQEAAAQADAGEDGTATLAQQTLTMAGREHVISVVASPFPPIKDGELLSFSEVLCAAYHLDPSREQDASSEIAQTEDDIRDAAALEGKIAFIDVDCERDNWQIRLRDGLMACQPVPEAGLSGANAIIVGLRGIPAPKAIVDVDFQRAIAAFFDSNLIARGSVTVPCVFLRREGDIKRIKERAELGSSPAFMIGSKPSTLPLLTTKEAISCSQLDNVPGTNMTQRSEANGSTTTVQSDADVPLDDEMRPEMDAGPPPDTDTQLDKDDTANLDSEMPPVSATQESLATQTECPADVHLGHAVLEIVAKSTLQTARRTARSGDGLKALQSKSPAYHSFKNRDGIVRPFEYKLEDMTRAQAALIHADNVRRAFKYKRAIPDDHDFLRVACCKCGTEVTRSRDTTEFSDGRLWGSYFSKHRCNELDPMPLPEWAQGVIIEHDLTAQFEELRAPCAATPRPSPVG